MLVCNEDINMILILLFIDLGFFKLNFSHLVYFRKKH